MNHFGWIVYQSLFHFVCYRFGRGEGFEYHLRVYRAFIDGGDEIWENVFISKHNQLSEFSFQDTKLNERCSCPFPSTNVEIVRAFYKEVRFSLMRGSYQLFVNLLFTEQSSVPLFFGDIRSKQKKNCGKRFRVGKLAQYLIPDSQDNVDDEERLQLLGSPVAVFLKNLDLDSDAFPKTLNFTMFRSRALSDAVYLVLQSMTFNIAKVVDLHVYILCAPDISTHRFILHFPHGKALKNFLENSGVRNLVNDQIPCPIDWVTDKILKQLYSL